MFLLFSLPSAFPLSLSLLRYFDPVFNKDFAARLPVWMDWCAVVARGQLGGGDPEAWARRQGQGSSQMARGCQGGGVREFRPGLREHRAPVRQKCPRSQQEGSQAAVQYFLQVLQAQPPLARVTQAWEVSPSFTLWLLEDSVACWDPAQFMSVFSDTHLLPNRSLLGTLPTVQRTARLSRAN